MPVNSLFTDAENSQLNLMAALFYHRRSANSKCIWQASFRQVDYEGNSRSTERGRSVDLEEFACISGGRQIGLKEAY